VVTINGVGKSSYDLRRGEKRKARLGVLETPSRSRKEGPVNAKYVSEGDA